MLSRLPQTYPEGPIAVFIFSKLKIRVGVCDLLVFVVFPSLPSGSSSRLTKCAWAGWSGVAGSV